MMPAFHSAKIRLNRALLAAVTRGDSRQASSLLSAGGTPYNCMSAAIIGGHRACFVMLVKRGVSINPGPMGPIGISIPPIYAAIRQSGDSWFFHALMELGAETNVPDRLGRTPLIYAIEHGCRHAVPTLAERDYASLSAAMSRQYRDAYARGDTQLPAPRQMIAALLAANVDPNAQPPAAPIAYQAPPLHAAVCADDLDAVCLLAKAGIDPFFADSRGMIAKDMLRLNQLRMHKLIEAVESAFLSSQPFDATPFQSNTFGISAADLSASAEAPQVVPQAATQTAPEAETAPELAPEFSTAIDPDSTTTMRLFH